MQHLPNKFKAWDKKAKRWVTSKDVNINSIPVTVTKDGFALKTKFVLCRWIGTTDSEGQDIYEHDLVEWQSDEGEFVSQYERMVGKIVWDVSFCRFCVENTNGILSPIGDFTAKFYRVIGTSLKK